MSHFVSCNVFPPLGNSDHNCIHVVLYPRRSHATRKQSTQHTIWKHALADFERPNSMLSDTDVDVYLDNSTDEAWSNGSKLLCL